MKRATGQQLEVIYSFSKYLLSIYYVPGTVLCAGDTTVNKTERKNKTKLHPSEADILEKKGTNKKISKYVFKYIVPYIVKHIVI